MLVLSWHFNCMTLLTRLCILACFQVIFHHCPHSSVCKYWVICLVSNFKCDRSDTSCFTGHNTTLTLIPRAFYFPSTFIDLYQNLDDTKYFSKRKSRITYMFLQVDATVKRSKNYKLNFLGETVFVLCRQTGLWLNLK